MKTVLVDSYAVFDKTSLPVDTQVKNVSCDNIGNYNGDEGVVAIAGSRALAKAVSKLSFPNLKLVQLTSAGFDGVPLEDFEQKGITVANVGGIYSVPIAETVVFGILQIAKKIRKNPNNRHFKLTRGYNTITELADKKVLIMGTGNIGTAVADRLKGFDCEISGYDPYSQEKPQYDKIIRTRKDLIDQLINYDFIVSTMPDNEQTAGFINKELFDAMKKTAVIINVGRKAVFNNNDFYIALKTKKIAAAVLDMFEKIPNPITNKFRRLSNVVVLPGVAAISNEVRIRLSKTIEKNVINVISNNKIDNVISRK